MTVGERIYYCRLENHMTQKELGEKAGIDPSTIRKYESGRLNPKIGTLKKIADALGEEITDLYPMDEVLADLDKEHERLKAETEKLEREARASHEESKKLQQQLQLRLALSSVEMSFGAGGRKLMESYSQLNDNGQRVAVERVQELAQIPAYQRTADAAEDADGKEPEEK